jgi:hypothetical protein
VLDGGSIWPIPPGVAIRTPLERSAAALSVEERDDPLGLGV